MARAARAIRNDECADAVLWRDARRGCRVTDGVADSRWSAKVPGPRLNRDIGPDDARDRNHYPWRPRGSDAGPSNPAGANARRGVDSRGSSGRQPAGHLPAPGTIGAAPGHHRHPGTRSGGYDRSPRPRPHRRTLEGRPQSPSRRRRPGGAAQHRAVLEALNSGKGRSGGPDRDRTGDLMNAIHARSQLRYRPTRQTLELRSIRCLTRRRQSHSHAPEPDRHRCETLGILTCSKLHA